MWNHRIVFSNETIHYVLQIKSPSFHGFPARVTGSEQLYFQNKSSGLVRTDKRDKDLDPSKSVLAHGFPQIHRTTKSMCYMENVVLHS